MVTDGKERGGKGAIGVTPDSFIDKSWAKEEMVNECTT